MANSTIKSLQAMHNARLACSDFALCVSLQSHLTMYSFGDIVRNYTLEPRFSISVDIQSRLAAVPTTNVSEYTFQQAAARVLKYFHTVATFKFLKHRC